MKDIEYNKQDALNEWNGVKCLLSSISTNPNISEGEIWWCSCGENVGVEINGKDRAFTRPVLVYHKFNKHSFLGVPLTSQKHTGSWYVAFRFQDKPSYAVLCQARVFDTKRLHNRVGQIAEDDFRKIIRAFVGLYGKE